MSPEKSDAEELRMRMVELQDEMPRIKKQLVVGLIMFSLVQLSYGWRGVGAALYFTVGFKMASSQGLGLSDWELYVFTFAWPILIVLDLVRMGVSK